MMTMRNNDDIRQAQRMQQAASKCYTVFCSVCCSSHMCMSLWVVIAKGKTVQVNNRVKARQGKRWVMCSTTYMRAFLIGATLAK